MCPENSSGHSGQPRAPAPPFTREPKIIPLEVIRDFVREEAEARGSRELARAWGVGHETFRKFHAGITSQPQPRQLQLYREKFLELHPSGYVREKQVDGKAHALPQLKMVLPPGRENAQRVVEQIQELVARHADELADEAPEAVQWLRKVLNAEYEAEGRLPPRKPRRTKPADP